MDEESGVSGRSAKKGATGEKEPPKEPLKEPLDVLELHGDWYSASDDPEDVTFGPVRGLSVTGQGEPGGAVHMDALNLLLAVARQLLDLAAKANAPFSMPVL